MRARLVGRHRPPARAIALRLAVLIVGWWAITEGDPRAMGFGVPVVAAALVVGLALRTDAAPRWSPVGLLGLAGFFALGSLRGGLDVARRALSPRLPLAPHVIRYRTRLSPGVGRELMGAALSLMPGTLVLGRDGDQIDVHVLAGADPEPTLARLEHHVARAIGARLGADPGAEGGHG